MRLHKLATLASFLKKLQHVPMTPYLRTGTTSKKKRKGQEGELPQEGVKGQRPWENTTVEGEGW